MSVQQPVHHPPPLPVATRDWVLDHPPFLRSSERFTKSDAFILHPGPGQAPTAASDLSYHVAYGDINRQAQRSSKGWAALDDPIKSGRGTSTGKHYSSMAPEYSGVPPCGSSLLPLTATYPNETRLQELIDLQKRKAQAVPGPGAYEFTQVAPHKVTFRRPPEPGVDGPFFLGEGEVSTRVRDIAAVFKNPGDSGLGPGEYDWSKKQGPMAKIGTSGRDGRTQHVKSLSISRSIAHSIDWHVPVIVQTRPAADIARGNSHGLDGGPGARVQQQQQAGLAAGGTSGTGTSGIPDSPSHVRGSSPHGLYSQQAENGSGDLAVAVGGSSGTSFSGRPFVSPPAEGMPPPLAPPTAVARTVRREHARMPGDWDWERLARVNRKTWATQGGGAYTHGERSSMVRDVLNADRSGGGADRSQAQGGGRDAQQQQQQQQQHADHAHANAGIFPIAEEASTSTLAAEREADPAAMERVVSAAGRPRTSSTPSSSLSRQDLDRRSQAASAAAHAQEVNMRRASWSQRSNGSAA